MERRIETQQILDSWNKSCKVVDEVDQEAKEVIRQALELKIAEEQGLLPKFHLGDEFWVIVLDEIVKGKVVMLQQKKDGTWKYRLFRNSSTADYSEDEYGKYFFATKEEAESQL